MQIIFYDTATGEIDFVQEYDDDTPSVDIDADTPDGESWIVGDGQASPQTDYVLAGVQSDRPVVAEDFTIDATADGITSITLAEDLPIGTVIEFGGEEITLSSVEDLVFKTALAGPFEINVTAPFPYQAAVFEILASLPGIPEDAWLTPSRTPWYKADGTIWTRPT